MKLLGGFLIVLGSGTVLEVVSGCAHVLMMKYRQGTGEWWHPFHPVCLMPFTVGVAILAGGIILYRRPRKR
jgi:hypothetical protein